MTAKQIKDEAEQLRAMYSGRSELFIQSFKLLNQNMEDFDKNMENVVGNDPRTLWNMANYLLQPRPLQHEIKRVDETPLGDREQIAADIISRRLNSTWRVINKKHMRRGGGTWFWDMIGMMLVTGWYTVSYSIDSNGLFVDYWNPGEVYPEFSTDPDIGLLKLARFQNVAWAEAALMMRKKGFNLNQMRSIGVSNTVEIIHLWTINDFGEPELGVVVGNEEVQPKTVVSGLSEIPILTGAVGGIPVPNGVPVLSGGDDPTKQAPINDNTLKGQSILATNEQVFKNINRMNTFLQQLVRDTANPKTWEKTDSARPIVANPEEFYKRGAHFTLGINEDLGVLPMPGIPVEVQQIIFGFRNMAQRGGISDIVFGNITQELTASLITQAAESAQQILDPFHSAVEFIASFIGGHWFDDIKSNPDNFKFLTDIEKESFKVLSDIELEVVADYTIQIPGDLAARANLAKFTSPSWELSPETAYEMFMPEVTDVSAEISKVRAARASQHPIMINLDVINALRVAASKIKQIRPKQAALLEKQAQVLENQISGQDNSGQAQTGLSPGIIPASVQQEQQNAG